MDVPAQANISSSFRFTATEGASVAFSVEQGRSRDAETDLVA